MNAVIKQSGQMLDELIKRGVKLSHKDIALECHNKLRQSLKDTKYSQLKQRISDVIYLPEKNFFLSLKIDQSKTPSKY